MDEVEGRVDALKRPIQRGPIEHVPRHDLGLPPHPRPEFLGSPGQAAEPDAPPFEERDEPPPDITAAAGQQGHR